MGEAGLSTKQLRDLFGGKIPTAQVLRGVASGMAACGVDVIIDPKCKVPCADPKNKRITLPAMVKSERALLIVRWHVDHEAGHIIFSPDMRPVLKQWKKASKMKDVCLKHDFKGVPKQLIDSAQYFLNYCEDSRVEHLMVLRYPGCKRNFTNGPIAADCTNIVEDTVTKAEELAVLKGLAQTPLSPFFVGMCHANALLDGYHGKRDLDFCRGILPPHVHWVLDLVDEDFADVKEVTELSFTDLIERVDTCMAKIMDKVLDSMEEGDDGEDEDDEKGETTRGDGDMPSPFSDKFKRGKDEKGGGDPDDEDDDSEESDEDDDSPSSGDDESDEDGDDKDTGKGDEESDEDDEEESDDSGDSEDDGDKDEESKDSEEKGDEEKEKELDDKLKEMLEAGHIDHADMMREGDPDDETEATKHEDTEDDYDYDGSIDNMPEQYLNRLLPGVRNVELRDRQIDEAFETDSSKFQAYDQHIRGLMPKNLGPAARHLVGEFRGAPGRSWTGNRINPRMLQRIRAGHAYGQPIMLRRIETTLSKQGVAVFLLVDYSGSMLGTMYGLDFSKWDTKLTVSHAAARGIARLLSPIRVPFAVGGFTTLASKHGSSAGGYSSGYSRYDDVLNMLFKDFHDSWTTSERRMLALHEGHYGSYDGMDISCRNNADGESVLWAATRLLQRQEQKKLLVVISDGYPQAGGDSYSEYAYLKWAIKRAMSAGLIVGGFGMGSDAVEQFYPIHEVLKEFPPGMGSEIMAPIFIQEKILALIEKMAFQGG